MKQGPAAAETAGEAITVAESVAKFGRSVLFSEERERASDDLAVLAPLFRQTAVAISEEVQARRFPDAAGIESHMKGTA